MPTPQYPQYGHPPVPVRVDAKELRPRRSWYVVGAGLIVLGVVVGITGFVAMIARTVALPDFEARLQGPGEVSFTVGDEVGQLGLYADQAGADADSCVLILPNGDETGFGSPSYSHTYETWSLVGAQPSGGGGEYTLVCEDGENAEDTVHAVADLGEGGAAFAGGVLGALASIFLAPLAGLAIGVPVIIRTALRRGRHKRRLLAERVRQPG